MKIREQPYGNSGYSGNNITKQMYESLRKEVDWEHKHPVGVILHAAAFEDSGNNIHVADVWESKEDLNRFVNERLMQVMQEAKVPAPDGTETELFQINDVAAYPGIEKYRIR
jgi:hypothetical protein